MANVTPLSNYRGRPEPQVFFDRRELDQILNVYGRMVAAGEWRDYAIDDNREEVAFSVFRRASEMPVYRIVKTPSLARKQGAYRILGADGQVLKRGHDLTTLLRYFDKRSFQLID